MGTIAYTAVDRGKLAAGHSAGTIYTIEIGFKTFNPKTKRVIKESTSLSGRVFSQFHRIEDTASLTTVWIDDVNIQKGMAEFFSSVAAGEDFTIDPYGSIATPVEPTLANLSRDANQTRFSRMERWNYSFSIRIQ